ncbi:neurobeachin-like protein 1 isoform X2 [Dermacentor silvarum]|uniref:neurobeachin-like protein 1 isoform X2 n=1 Tax=Dermacentor silvarum TaxID=543639 RepID=UPI0018993EE4|nr:neurobeachin-like protein 1 isoform X2 [Dermacentor silvarum]
MSAKEALEALWSAYQIKRNSTTLSEYMVEFRRQYGDCLKTDFPANPSRSVASPHLIDLPEGFLQVVELYLRECSDECNTGVTVETVQKASVAVQVLSILSRNFNNIPFVSTSDAVPLVIVISSAVANQYTQHSKDANDQNTQGFLLSVLVFLEVLYDPHLIWQKMCAKVPVDSNKCKVSPSHLHLEVIPFFYDCLSSKPCFLPASIQMKLIHVFGAIICGAQHNAQVAINQNTVEILFQRLREQECPLEVKMTAVRCILQGIVTLCASPPEARKVDVDAFVREYLGTLSKLMTEEEKPTQVDTAQWMMSGLQELFSSNSNSALKKVFHDNELVERLIRSLHGTKLKSGSAQKMATSSVRLIHVFLSNVPFAKKHFSSMQGYRTLISTLKTMGEPQQCTLETLLEWLVEETPRLTGTSSTLRNLELMIHLLHWLPQLESHSLQLWLAEQLDSMVKGSLRSRMACARGGVIPAIIHVLGRSNTIGGKAVGQLLRFLVTLASCSISTSELKALFHLLRPSTSGEQHQYTLPLMYALSSMVKSDGWLGASHFFDFSDLDEGIVIPNIRKWPGSGFAFHAWVRLEKLNVRKEAPFRRQLYSFTSPNGTLESFFTAQGKLVVAVATKKDYYAVPVEGITLDDETWHSVDVCHTPARRPFTNSTTTVFIDGRQRVSVQVKLPSLSEFSQCHVAWGNSNEPSALIGERRSASGRGSGDSSTSTSVVEHSSGAGEEQTSQNTVTGGFLKNSALGSFLSGWDTDKIFSMAPSVPANLRSAFNADPDPSINVSPLESHEQVWGLSRGLKGQIGSLCLFSEPLQASQVKMMYTGGPRNYTLFKNEDSVEVAELLGKLVLYYDAKASVDGTCTNLAPSSSLYDGKFTGRYCHTQNVKDTVNLIGGFPTLYVLLENSGKPIPKCSPSFEAASTPSSNKASEEIVDDWIVVPSSSSSFSGPQFVLLDLLRETEGNPKTLAKDLRLAQNQVSSFLVIVQHLMQGSPENQMQLLARTGIPTIGALMQRVPGHCIDVNVLMAVQLLVENASSVENAQEMLQLVYQHILFDFRIWSKGSFAVRLGHIQYLTTIIKEDRKYFRKKYGPRFMLDMVQMFYSDCSLLTSDDVKTIRMAVLSLVKFYMMRDVSIQDVNAVVSYVLSQRKEELAKEMIEMLLHLLESPSTKDQLVLLLYEPNCAELFYCILLNREFSSCTKVKVLKVIQALLKSGRVYEKSKSRLRLAEVGFASLTGLLSPNEVTSEVARELVNLILMSDISQGFPGFLAVLNLIKNMDIELKFYAAKKLLGVLTDSAALLPQLAAQTGWQECVLSLLIKEPISESSCANRATVPALDLIDLNSLEADASADSEKPGSPVLKRGTLHRLSQKALVAQQSLDEIMPGSPKASQIFTHLKEHIFDFEITQFLGSARSRTNSQCSSQEDLASDAAQRSSPVSVTPSSLRRAPDQSPRISPAHKMLGISPVRSPVENGLSGGTEEQLIDCVVEAAFLLAWRGIEGSSKQSWMERGQVLVCVNKLALTNELVASHLEIKRRLFERLLQACCTSLQESGQANATYAENASELMKLVFDFVCHENVEDESRLSEKLLEHVLMVMDLLMVFGESPGDEGWEDMSKLALGILLVCAASHKLELCAMATARLHTLVQTRPFASLEESCYLLTGVNTVLAKAVKDGDQEQYSFVIPVVRALLERVGLRLRAWQHLPSQPNMDAGPAFFDQFQKYALTPEWTSFVSNVVRPVQEQYSSMLIREQHEAMNGFWNQCYEGIMVAMHRRSRGVGESKLRFQSQILSAFQTRLVEEQQRILAVQTNLRNQHLFICRRWKATKLFLTGPCGPWASSVIKPLYWKLSQQENFARMRLKLTLNHNFDSHYQASCLRDNQGILANQNTSWLPPITAEARAMQQKEDIVAEEDIQALQGQVQDLENPDGIIDKKKPVIEEDCELVTLMKVVKGRFEVTATQIYFIDLSPVREEGERHDFTYPLHMLREVHLRRYNLRRSALEFFLVDQTNFFLNFATKTRNKIFGRVVALHPPNLLYSSGTRSPAELLRASGLTQRWVNREISNFEYLMHLNTIAGRTYNDLSQYPVFPWVLADYSSPKLDFDNPSVYRDLSRPIGIVNPKNIEVVKAKFDSFVDITGTVEKFHYGTHYSNSAGVLHYLVRLEPFTSLHIELQSGRFDVADRQFHSVEATWKMLMESPNDVKELIPEFFYLPEFLTNMNAFDLGRLQGTKEQVDDVRLPAWATSPEDFIYKHRKALESEYVSLHLHDWIDLIFGYKQKGPAAAEALNVFYYVSYEGAVDLDAIKDPVQREATEGIINNFGQTPCQLLKEPHPRRLSYEGAMLRMTKSDTKPPNLFLFLQNLKAYVVDDPLSCPVVHVNIPRSPARSFMQHGLMDTLVTVGCDGSLGVHGWLPYDRTRSYPNYFTFERDPNIQNPKSAKKLAGVFQPGAKVHSRLFVLSSDGKFLVSGGHWDNSVRAYSLLRSKQVAHVILHKDVVTSLATDSCGMYLMTGSRDTTCIIWELNQLGPGSFLPNKPFQILCGHDSEVTCVAVITELDMALSGSKDGTVNVHSVREGHFLHTLRLPGDMPEQVALLSVSHLGFICIHSCPDPQALLKSGYVLHLYTINGKYLLRKEVARAISDMIVCDDYLITGDEDGLLVIYELFGLAEKVSLPLCSPILTVARTPTNSHLICSLSDGKLVVIGISTSSLRSSS